jgi:hypothetical protein
MWYPLQKNELSVSFKKQDLVVIESQAIDFGYQLLLTYLEQDELFILKAGDVFGFNFAGKPIGFLHFKGEVLIPGPIIDYIKLGCPAFEQWKDLSIPFVYQEFGTDIDEIKAYCYAVKTLFQTSIDEIVENYSKKISFTTKVVIGTVRTGGAVVSLPFRALGTGIRSTTRFTNYALSNTLGRIPLAGSVVKFGGKTLDEMGYWVGERGFNGVGKFFFNPKNIGSKRSLSFVVPKVTNLIVSKPHLFRYAGLVQSWVSAEAKAWKDFKKNLPKKPSLKQKSWGISWYIFSRALERKNEFERAKLAERSKNLFMEYSEDYPDFYKQFLLEQKEKRLRLEYLQKENELKRKQERLEILQKEKEDAASQEVNIARRNEIEAAAQKVNASDRANPAIKVSPFVFRGPVEPPLSSSRFPRNVPSAPPLEELIDEEIEMELDEEGRAYVAKKAQFAKGKRASQDSVPKNSVDQGSSSNSVDQGSSYAGFNRYPDIWFVDTKSKTQCGKEQGYESDESSNEVDFYAMIHANHNHRVFRNCNLNIEKFFDEVYLTNFVLNDRN